MTLVDTSVWIDFFAARNTAQVALLESSIDQREDLCLCGVILTEVLQGIRDDEQHKRTESILSSLTTLPMDQGTFLLAANIYRTLRSRGITMRNSVDCLIAAVCIERKAQLLHNDRDFDHIADIFDLQVLGSRNVRQVRACPAVTPPRLDVRLIFHGQQEPVACRRLDGLRAFVRG